MIGDACLAKVPMPHGGEMREHIDEPTAALWICFRGVDFVLPILGKALDILWLHSFMSGHSHLEVFCRFVVNIVDVWQARLKSSYGVRLACL